MKKPTTGTYEYTRDSDRLPVCWDYPNNHCLPHFHSNLEIIYVRDGEMKATLNGKTVTVLPGQVVLVPTYAVHHFSTETESDTLLLIVPLDYIPAFKNQLMKKTFAQECESTMIKALVNCCTFWKSWPAAAMHRTPPSTAAMSKLLWGSVSNGASGRRSSGPDQCPGP